MDFAETRILQVLFLSFGVLCMVQAILNVSLRLTCEYGFLSLNIYFTNMALCNF